MQKGKRVRVEKVDKTDKPFYRTAKEGEWLPGQENLGLSPPTGYWLEGTLLKDIAIGSPIEVDRKIRNGIEVDGVFQSSVVKAWAGHRGEVLVMTQNSQYRVTSLEELEN